MSPGLKGQNRESWHRSQLSPNVFHEVGWTHTSTWGTNAGRLSFFHLCRSTSAWCWCKWLCLEKYSSWLYDEESICLVRNIHFVPQADVCGCPYPRGPSCRWQPRHSEPACLQPFPWQQQLFQRTWSLFFPNARLRKQTLTLSTKQSPALGQGACSVMWIPPLLPGHGRYLWKGDTLPALQRSWAEINGGCLPLCARRAWKPWPPAILKHNPVVLSSFRPLISNVKREKKLVAGLEERLKHSGQHML